MRNSTCLSVLMSGILVFSLMLLSAGGVAAVSYPFSDDFESGLTNWSASAPWGLTTAYYSSTAHSVTDSPGTLYGASVDVSLEMASSVDLTSAVSPALVFHHRYQIEEGYDSGTVEISTDGGASWSAVLATYSGSQSSWTREQLDLSSYVGQNDLRIRFRFVSDASVQQDGWYIDDLSIGEAPAAVTLSAPSASSPNAVDLSWTASADADFSSYRIYRSTSSPLDWHTATLVTEISNSATTTYTDVTVSPKSSYFYAVMVMTSRDLHSLSAEQSVTTPAGMDYPFLDNAEGTGSDWTAEAPWAISTEAAFAGTHAWSDSPGGNYGDGIASQSLTLVSPLDLSSAVDPILSFEQEWVFAAGDSGNVEISTDSGSTWVSLASYTNGDSGGWRRVRMDLAAYAGQASVLIRFRITTDPSTNADGWHLDDISVAESPTVVDPPILDQVTSHSMRLTWNRCNDTLFSHYAIFRSATTGVGINSTLVTTISDQDTTTYTDSGLTISTDYYYRVYAINPYGTFSPDSASESTTTTGGNPMPFSDDFEGSLDAWDLTGSWGATDTDKHGGSYSLTDSPGTTYADSSDTEARTAIDLSGATWPVLSFWDRFAFADTSDWGIVEISTNGSTWTRVYTVTGARVSWAQQSIDLSPWKTSTNLQIRFRLMSNSSGADDGWYIDDVSIAQHSGSTSLPFFDGAEAGTGNWIAAAWAQSTDSPRTGTSCFRSTPQGKMLSYTEHSMELGGELDLSSAVDPQLVYWVRGSIYGSLRADISINGGQNWTALSSIGSATASWTRYQISLASYLQSGVRIRFIAYQASSYGVTDLYLDDIAIEEMPQAVVLNSPDQISTSSMRLTWNDPGNPDFAAYRLYRSDTATVDTSSELLTTITDHATTSFTDTGLQARKSYHYRVYLVDTSDVFSPSNISSAMTAGITLPFTDDFETDSGAWSMTGDWARQAGAGSGGSTGLSDSPGDYSPSSDTWAVTGFDFSAVSWPMLSFADSFDIGSGDYGRVEVSSNGGANWTLLYSANGTSAGWESHFIDLSPWHGEAQVWIRFRLTSDSGTPTTDGWHLDGVYVGENSLAGTLSYPFFDGAEGGIGNWLNGPWGVTTDTPYEGSACFVVPTVGARLGGTESRQVWGDAIDLSASVDPILTFQIRGDLGYHTYFRVQVSTDAGTTWQDLSDLNLNYYWNSTEWVRMQTSLSSYLVSDLRLRFVLTGSSGAQIFLDNISVGPQTPAAPTLNSPAEGADVPDTHPTLVINNAIDYQSDPLNYEFQVFSDAALTTQVAQIPVVASGTGTTSWLVDTALDANTQYWWRCRATDDSSHTGDWMATATFFVQLTGHPPTVPVITGPSNGGELPDLTGRLSWLISTDPDEANGDYVDSYGVQVDEDPAFGSPEIDTSVANSKSAKDAAFSVALGSLSGSAGLIEGTRYYWRVNAKDSHGMTSAWSAGPTWFVYGSDQNPPSCTISSPADGATLSSTPITISGTSSDDLSGTASVEVSTDGGASWNTAVGTDSWAYQWAPSSSGDYQLSCRATDEAANQGAASTAITAHVDLSRSISYAVDSAVVAEDGGTANVTLVLSGARSDSVSVEVVLNGGTAIAGTDFQSPAQTITFAPGQTAASFTVTINDDDLLEGDETVILGLSNPLPTDIVIGSLDTFTLSITDNELPPLLIDGFESGDLSGWTDHIP